VRLRIHVRSDHVRFEVRDPGPGFTAPVRPQPRPAGGGLGLVLVDAMSRAWGVERADGTAVWFELPRRLAA
jgi:signal transduction histidine kinase